VSVTAISIALRAEVRSRANGLCEYCHSSELVSGHYFEVDHVMPESKGGQIHLDNLALACRSCNLHKADRVDGRDPNTGQLVKLFNPRLQRWQDHFAWSNDGAQVMPLTPVRRATIVALNMNDLLVVSARAIWVTAGKHPPEKPTF